MNPEVLLATARQQARQGNVPLAIASYEACLSHHLPVHAEYAGTLYQHARFTEAVAIIERALAVTPDDPHLFFLRALALLANGQAFAARADLDTCIRVDPANLSYLRKRAALLAQLDVLDAALEDFTHIARLTPEDLDALGNCGIIHLRRNEYPEAIRLLSHYLIRRPDNSQVVRSLANAHRGHGNIDTALELLGGLMARTPEDDAIQTDYALTLLAKHEYDDAYSHYQTVAKRSPTDQWALTGLYLASEARGDPASAQKLMDSTLVIKANDDGLVDRSVLGKEVLSHQGLRWEPTGKSTTGGQQTTLLDLTSHPFKELSHLLHQRVEQVFQSLTPACASDSAHPWHRGRPEKWKLQAWATVLHGLGGHQRPHIHPVGWLSGVYYLDSGDGEEGQGQLVFGHPPDELQLNPPHHDFSHASKTGELLFFPSFFLHHTTPYAGSAKRISIAFDVVPLA